MEDTIIYEIDDNGNIISPAVTVTERDGIQIIAEVKENWKRQSPSRMTVAGIR